MPRFRTFAYCWLGCFLLTSGEMGLLAEEIRFSERLLPDSTQGFFAVSSVEKLNEHWEKTQLGHLMADPVMEPFTKDVQRQFESRWSSVHERLGLTLKDMAGVSSGDVGIGLIACEADKAALAIVMDVTGKLPQAREMIDKVSKAQLKRGAKRSEMKLENYPDVVIIFDMPESVEECEAKKSGSQKEENGLPVEKESADEAPPIAPPAAEGDDTIAVTKEIKIKDALEVEEKPVVPGDKEEVFQPAPPPKKPPSRQSFYCLTDNLLIITDDLSVLKGILGRKSGEGDDSLADSKPFQIVMKRCAEDYGESPPQMRWFLSPLGYAEAARAATPEHRRRKGKSILEVMKNQGVEAVQGMGGLADFSSEGYELIHRTTVYAPRPYVQSMKMLVFLNREDFVPQDWVPRDIATYTTFYFDILNAFDNFGPLFDELVGQGTKDAWKEAVDGLKLDPKGPQVDLREDLVKHLGYRVSMLTDYRLPISTTSERLLFAIEVNDAEAVAKAIEKLLKTDPTVKRREKAGHVIWEIVGEKAEPPKMELDFGGVPHIAPIRPPEEDDPWEDEEEERKPLLPHAAVTVCKGHLFVASHIDFLLKIIAPEEEPDLLRDDVDYQLVAAEIDKFKPDEKCFRFFSRTDEEYRSTYELIRQNKMPESETMLARMLNVLFGEGKKGTPRAQKIDGSQLPDYQVVRRYLGPAGMQITSEKDGWFLKGFTLSKEAE
ncbi:MAG: hypothetical protein JW959_06645 [Pirellulales bacterium]|nr:hypothetical protein [Pirellulales bacterium]